MDDLGPQLTPRRSLSSSTSTHTTRVGHRLMGPKDRLSTISTTSRPLGAHGVAAFSESTSARPTAPSRSYHAKPTADLNVCDLAATAAAPRHHLRRQERSPACLRCSLRAERPAELGAITRPPGWPRTYEFCQPSTLPTGLAEVRRILMARPDPEVFLIFINHRLEITSIVWAGWPMGLRRSRSRARATRREWMPRCDCRQGSVNSIGLPSGECHTAPGLAELIAG
jgi:hypothetical protein